MTARYGLVMQTWAEDRAARKAAEPERIREPTTDLDYMLPFRPVRQARPARPNASLLLAMP